MARARKHRSMLSLLTAAAGAVPALPAALVVMAPASVALAAAPAGPAPMTLAQAIARGDVTIASKQVQSMILAQRRDFTLVDIRSPAAFAAGHIRDARNVPLAKLGTPEEINVLRRSPQVILYSDTSVEAAEAAVMLRGAGVMARALSGGLAAWGKSVEALAAKPEQAAVVRALNICPEVSVVPIQAPGTLKPAAPAAAPAPSATPPARKAPGKINLNAMCG